MADIALISVISSAAVGVLGSLSGLYGQRVTVKLDKEGRREARRDDLRNVLDEAAQLAMKFDKPIEGPEAHVREWATEVDKMAVGLDAKLGRIGMRLGPNAPAYTTYRQVKEACFTLVAELLRFPLDAKLTSLTEDSEGWDDAYRDCVDRARRAFIEVEAAMERFLSSATKALAEE